MESAASLNRNGNNVSASNLGGSSKNWWGKAVDWMLAEKSKVGQFCLNVQSPDQKKLVHREVEFEGGMEQLSSNTELCLEKLNNGAMSDSQFTKLVGILLSSLEFQNSAAKKIKLDTAAPEKLLSVIGRGFAKGYCLDTKLMERIIAELNKFDGKKVFYKYINGEDSALAIISLLSKVDEKSQKDGVKEVMKWVKDNEKKGDAVMLMRSIVNLLSSDLVASKDKEKLLSTFLSVFDNASGKKLLSEVEQKNLEDAFVALVLSPHCPKESYNRVLDTLEKYCVQKYGWDEPKASKKASKVDRRYLPNHLAQAVAHLLQKAAKIDDASRLRLLGQLFNNFGQPTNSPSLVDMNWLQIWEELHSSTDEKMQVALQKIREDQIYNKESTEKDSELDEVRFTSTLALVEFLVANELCMRGELKCYLERTFKRLEKFSLWNLQDALTFKGYIKQLLYVFFAPLNTEILDFLYFDPNAKKVSDFSYPISTYLDHVLSTASLTASKTRTAEARAWHMTVQAWSEAVYDWSSAVRDSKLTDSLFNITSGSAVMPNEAGKKAAEVSKTSRSSSARSMTSSLVSSRNSTSNVSLEKLKSESSNSNLSRSGSGSQSSAKLPKEEFIDLSAAFGKPNDKMRDAIFANSNQGGNRMVIQGYCEPGSMRGSESPVQQYVNVDNSSTTGSSTGSSTRSQVIMQHYGSVDNSSTSGSPAKFSGQPQTPMVMQHYSNFGSLSPDGSPTESLAKPQAPVVMQHYGNVGNLSPDGSSSGSPVGNMSHHGTAGPTFVISG